VVCRAERDQQRSRLRKVFYDEAGNVIETHEHAGELKEW
jgi:hypothetical protein